MNLSKRRRKKQEETILLSPLIDCVFLLLIFFLVTSMIKRFERQIPVKLSDDTSAITREPNDDSYPIGVDTAGKLYSPAGQTWSGIRSFARLANSEAWLKSLLTRRGPDKPVSVIVERGTPFQKVIDVQDRLELIGFDSIRFRIRDFPLTETGEANREN